MQDDDKVLSKPRFGWTQVRFPGVPAISASYLTSVPIDLMAFADDYFSGKDAEMVLDSEGDYWEISCAGNKIDFRNCDELEYSVSIDEHYMRNLAQGAFDDIRENLFDWLVWECDADDIPAEYIDLLCGYLSKIYAHLYPGSAICPDFKQEASATISLYLHKSRA